MSVQIESGETEQEKVQEFRVLKQALEYTLCQGCSCKAECSFHVNPWGPRLTALSPVRDLSADLLSCWMFSSHKRYLCLVLWLELMSSSVLLKGES